MAQSWDRIPGETPKAFACLVEYLRLGPNRSLEKAAELSGKQPRTLRKWSVRYGWVRRAAEYDAFVLGQEREMALVLTREKAVVWAKRQERLKEAEWEIAERLIERARELLDDSKVRW